MVIGCFNQETENATSELMEIEDEEGIGITVLYDTHLHGTFGDEEVNLAKYVDLINSIRSEKENVLFLGAGDEISPSLMSSFWQGEHMIEALNVSGLEVTTIGNHEFDYGIENLENIIEQSEFQWVSANVIDKQTGDVLGKEQGAERFIIKSIDGVNLGITGLTPMKMIDSPALGEVAEVVHYIEAMETIIPEMKEAGADIILVLSHLANYDSEELAGAVDGIDIIFGDDDSKVIFEPKYINDTIVSFVGDEYDYLGEINLQIVNSEIADWSYTLHEVKDHDVYDEKILEIMDRYNNKLDEELMVEIGERTVEFDTLRESTRYMETAIGNFVTDVLREWANSDVAIHNGGGLRGDQVWEANEPILRKDIQEILPFQNYATKLEVTGELLLEVLEHSVFEEGNGFLQVSGIEMIYDSTKDAGERIVEVNVNGKPLDIDKVYTLATIDYLHTGGDGYGMLLNATPIITGEEGPLVTNLVIEAIDKIGVVSSEVEGRTVDLGQ
jgi:2',3'-cyclic-nucleotide 2'-phosphodiesterase/3'-nucleotidase